jgi:hypothetical protein
MQASTMRKSKLGMVVFAAALAAGWMGCAADATSPDKGPEPVASSSAALTATSSSGIVVQAGPDGTPVPNCDQGPWTTVMALPHSAAYTNAFEPSNYTVSANYGGQWGGYSMPCGTPVSGSTGYLVPCGSDPNVYEQDLYSQVYRSNGYAYFVYATVEYPVGNVPRGLSRTFIGVGINSSTASPAWSVTPPPAPGHPVGGSPTSSDWAAEQNLVSTAPGASGDVQANYLTCVQVVAADTGVILDFFPVLDLHDPINPPW